MASKKFTKDTSEWMLFQDFWSLCQKYWQPEESSEYWHALINDTDNFTRKYNDTNKEFVKNISLALLDTIHEIYKHNKN